MGRFQFTRISQNCAPAEVVVGRILNENKDSRSLGFVRTMFTLRLRTIAGKQVAVRMRRLIKELLRYLKNNEDSLANYGQRYRSGRRRSWSPQSTS
jgi:hypothetical protein